MPAHERRTRVGVEHEPHRILAVADPEWVDLTARLLRADRRADLEHVGAEDQRIAWAKVIGVVLHERGAAGTSGRHGFHDPEQRGGFPVALGPEAVAVGHQPLWGDSGELLERAEVLEVGGERLEFAVFEEVAEPGLDARGVDQRRVARAIAAELGDERVALLVVGDDRVDGVVGGLLRRLRGR